MKPEFSEFTYGYTLIEELSKLYNFKSAPVFPSLREEGKIGGYDSQVNIEGIPFFIQFKRSDYLSTKNAKYYSKFNSTYYRFSLHALRYSKQHNLLLSLESSNKNVFYVAPKFHENSTLNNLYTKKRIVEKSIWVRPSEIGKLPDNDAHSVCFNSGGSLVYFCSNPKKLLVGDFGAVRRDVVEILHKKDAEKIQSNVESKENYDEIIEVNNPWEVLFDEMSQIASASSPSIINEFRRIESNNLNYLQKCAKLSRFAFGCELIII